MSAPLPASVVIPTIGRRELLAACLRSLAACDPPAAEVLVVDQGGDPELRKLSESAGARLVPSRPLGIAHGTNLGLREARHRTALVTHDDCTVAADWVRLACELAEREPTAIFTGRMLPVGDPARVPSRIDDPEPRDHTGRPPGALFPGNMVCDAPELLAFGGFDERLAFAAEDNDLCYRWLRAGRVLKYEPRLTVWHHDWRTPDELREVYVQYARGDGMFYAKHLRRGDPRMVAYIARALGAGVAGRLAALARGRDDAEDWRLGVLRGLPAGLREGWALFRNG